MKLSSDIQELENFAQASKDIRSRFEKHWYLNMAFYNGNQWVFWNNGRLDTPKLPKHRLLIVDNRILPVVQTRIAKKTKQRPIWTVTPNSPDDSDIDAAKLGEVVMEDMWRRLSMFEKLNDVLMWADIAAAGFWKCYWDPTAGEKAEFVLGPDGKPLTDDNGRMMKTDEVPPELLQKFGAKTKVIAQGEICIEVRSPFMILPDPLAQRLDDCEWIIEETVQSEEYVKAHYNVEVEGDTDTTEGPADGRTFPTYTESSGSSAYQGVKVKEFWAKPSSTFPQGKYVVWVKNQKLHEDDNYYNDLPYVMFTGVPSPGRFWPTSIVEQLRDPQIELNKIRSQILENAQRIGNPSLLKNKMANVEYSGVPGEEVLYDDITQNSVPSFLQPPEMPAYVRELIDRNEASIREISGQHEVSSSQVPAGVTAASAINLLLEQDDTRLGPAIQDMENALSKAGQFILNMAAKYYTEERMLTRAGEEGDYDIQGFRGNMLKNNTAVEVQAGSMMPVSKAAKQAAMRDQLTMFIQNGVPLEPRIMRKAFRDMEVGGLEVLFADLTEGLRQCKRENRYLYQGMQLPINSFDDDDLHISEHEEEMRSSRYFRMMIENPQAAEIFEQHVMLHRDRRAQAQEQEQQQQLEMAQAQSGMQTQSTLATQGQDNQAEMERLTLQQHFQELESQRNAQLKLRQIQAQERIAAQRNSQGPPRNG
jgi:hypothetical protein